jgi:23S rRNA pseudouridine2605 synthase
MTPGGERNEQRLQKILAAAGIASRRKAEELILTGRVRVNGQTVTQLGSKADPVEDHIRVDGRPVKLPHRAHYYMLNKPKGVVTTVSDPEGRPTVMKFVPRDSGRVFPVGRLDYQSEGLLLLTDDGALANALTRAATRVERTYLVKVSGQPSADALEQLRQGVMIEKGRRGAQNGRVMTQPARIRRVRDAENPWFEVVLHEGINREIRKMFEEVGHFVEKIRRVGFGPLILDLEPGKIRELTAEEVVQLQRAARPRSGAAKKPARPKRAEQAFSSDRPSQPARSRSRKRP